MQQMGKTYSCYLMNGVIKNKIEAQRRKRMNEGEADGEERRDGEHGDKTKVQRGSECRELRGRDEEGCAGK